ncbi:hypothetical protein LCGC14_1856070, partial [marine sediment metagenome]
REIGEYEDETPCAICVKEAAVMEVWIIGLGFALILYGAGYIWRNHDD